MPEHLLALCSTGYVGVSSLWYKAIVEEVIRMLITSVYYACSVDRNYVKHVILYYELEKLQQTPIETESLLH